MQDMRPEADLVTIAKLPLEEAKLLQRDLRLIEVPATLNHDPSCRSGCSVTIDVVVPFSHAEAAVKLLRERFQAAAERPGMDWEKAQATFDPSQQEATCPACGTSFATTSSECPECGLCF